MILNDLMFEVPSDDTITKIIINGDVIENKAEPEIVRNGFKAQPQKTNSKVLDAEEVS